MENNNEKYPIIFLDLDSVLTTPETKYKDFDPHCVENLKFIIKETGCKIIVHSTWRNFSYNRKLFFYLWGKWGFDLNDFWDFAPIIGKKVKDKETGEDIEYYATKKDCIDKWLEDNKSRVENYCIIDDEDYNFDPKVFVQPICSFGLSYLNALDVIKILNKE